MQHCSHYQALVHIPQKIRAVFSLSVQYDSEEVFASTWPKDLAAAQKRKQYDAYVTFTTRVRVWGTSSSGITAK